MPLVLFDGYVTEPQLSERFAVRTCEGPATDIEPNNHQDSHPRPILRILYAQVAPTDGIRMTSLQLCMFGATSAHYG
jgi:hypothetical protein